MKSEKKKVLKKRRPVEKIVEAETKITEKVETAIVKTDPNLPAYMKQGTNRGMEEANVDDFEIPRLTVVQSLSSCRDKESPDYIEGIEEGDLYNNVTREVFGSEVMVVPVFFKKEFLLWKDISKGGGYGGAADTLEEAEALLTDSLESELIQGPLEDWEIVATSQYYCLLITEGQPEQIVISMAKSKNKVSRRWNSLIRINGADTFSRAYLLAGVSETNDQNQKYYNFKVSGGDFVPEDVYKAAEEMYKLIQSGRVTINRSVDGVTPDGEDEGEEKY